MTRGDALYHDEQRRIYSTIVCVRLAPMWNHPKDSVFADIVVIALECRRATEPHHILKYSTIHTPCCARTVDSVETKGFDGWMVGPITANDYSVLLLHVYVDTGAVGSRALVREFIHGDHSVLSWRDSRERIEQSHSVANELKAYWVSSVRDCGTLATCVTAAPEGTVADDGTTADPIEGHDAIVPLNRRVHHADATAR
jgi:hypothetical protein